MAHQPWDVRPMNPRRVTFNIYTPKLRVLSVDVTVENVNKIL